MMPESSEKLQKLITIAEIDLEYGATPNRILTTLAEKAYELGRKDQAEDKDTK